VSDAATVNLYLDLEPGQAADLEVVARAALAFAAAIRVIAQEIAPEVDVKVELVSGTEGSLSLNSLIKGAGLLASPETLKRIAVAVIVYFAIEGRDYVTGKLFDIVAEQPEAAKHLSKEDIQAIADAVRKQQAAPQVRQVFREAERDPAIRGLGAGDKPGVKPHVIVPRERFAEVGHIAPRELTEVKRIVEERQTVVLVSPVLVEGNRRWKFRGPAGEFGAPVRDADFIERVLSGTTSVPMVAGILMDVELEVTEERRGGIWVPVERVVTRVLGMRPPETTQQARLFPRDGQPGERDH
jgi:hypothetical protein